MTEDNQERYFKDDSRSVIPLVGEYPNGYIVEPHHHRRHQLLYGSSGLVIVATPHGTWVMPPRRGLWIPAGTTHNVKIVGAVTMHSLYFEPRDVGDMPTHCQVLDILPFMRSLIAEAMRLPSDFMITDRTSALMTLIKCEIRTLPSLPLSLEFPKHEALAGRCQSFLKLPNSNQTIDEWSLALNMSRRSFTRLFKKETGLSFMEWRQQACLINALPRLMAGEAVTTIAIDLGYDNPAAFSSMFKRILGASPRTYLGLSL